jgi:hypothetical protein
MEPMGRIYFQIQQYVKSFLTQGADKYNALPERGKKIVVLTFGSATAVLCLLLIMQSLYDNVGITLSIDPITKTKDAYMPDSTFQHQDALVPVGKLKGEYEGEFDAFYLAVDKEGSLFINRSLEYSPDAYRKENGWEPISRNELRKYEEQLHFIPHRKPGLRP